MTRLLALLIGFSLLMVQPAVAGQVRELKVTVLSTMLVDDSGIGEWGYSALVVADGKKFLFDTGANPDTVLKNAAALGVDLSDVEDVVVSHHHTDHTGGLLALRQALMQKAPGAMSRVHVSVNIFTPRLKPDGSDGNGLAPKRGPYEATGGHFILHDGPTELAPGVWFTGPVPRKFPETNWSDQGLRIHTSAGDIADNIPDDAALVFNTSDGLVILTGCGHAGIVNIATYAQAIAGQKTVVAVIGGLHLFAKPDDIVDWTGAQLKSFGVKYLLAGHCTGIEATMRLRRAIGLDRHTAPVSSVGSSFTLHKGIDPGKLAA
jgi:7,8-dihydropterin-6-yl-methyl-4-(beta-D-ribofuranosyl)aminobenzene 5'-phosphate synthase